MSATLAILALILAAIATGAAIALRLALRRAEVKLSQVEAERATLRVTADRSDAILDDASIGIFMLDELGRFIRANTAFSRLTGYSIAELLEMRIEELEVPGLGEATSPSTSGAAVISVQRRKDGSLVRLETTVSVAHEGAVRRIVGFARDVSVQLDTERHLRESETRYRNLVEMSTDLIWALDLDGHWTFVNSAARLIYGSEPGEMLGRSIFERTTGAHRERMSEVLQALRRGERRLRFETEHIRRDGSPVYLSVNALPVRDERGRVVGITGTSTDISHRRQTEERLRAAHGRFQSLVDGMPLGYIVWSEDFRVIEWNPAATTIFGYREDEALGCGAGELIVAAEARESFAAMCRDLRTGRVAHGATLINRRKDGEKIACEWYNTVLPDTLGTGRVIATLVRDVSERERLEAQLRQSQRLESLGVLAGGIAHDFNNLLVGIMGNASLAIESLPYDSPLRPLLERVVAGGRRATDLTQRMLAYAGRTTSNIELLDLNGLVTELAVFASAAIPKHVSLTINTAPELPIIEADAAQMQQVVMNLLINAAEAIGETAGEVTVVTWSESLDEERIETDYPEQGLRPGRHVTLEIRDTGCGMSADVRARMFEPFFTTKFAGRGLGLSAILGIVRAHRGAITCSSVEGEGTTFRLIFPAVAARAETRKAPRMEDGLLPGATILVIDDEEDVRDVVQSVLERRGVEVLTAGDGASGIELYRANLDRVCAVLLDINMPGMNGEAVFRELRQIRSDVRVVVSTGYSEQEAAVQFASADIAGFVHKPYTASMLVEKLGRALRGEAQRPEPVER